jgi:N-methylhydantoinase A/oxoprolinase/acetone carboxylase beta subunit
MILGLDVGGTQTDAVLLNRHEVVAETKTPTGDDLLETLREALQKTLHGVHPDQVERMVFSTTLATNAILQDQLVDVGMIVSAGPGMDPRAFEVGPAYRVVQGCLDHQGAEAIPLDRGAVLEASERIKTLGIKHLGVVTKFSVRNPAHELRIAEWAGDGFAHVAFGHRISGTLNFPRRIATTYLNAALHDLHRGFVDALNTTLAEMGLRAPRYLLKPDGGTVEFTRSLDSPAKIAQSGPAASVMGALALDDCMGATLVLDVGGTTTDMAVIINGEPLLDPVGVRLGPYRTLIRSLLTHSTAVGGDSQVRLDAAGRLRIGPLRLGRPMGFGGQTPTPTDAMITLGLLHHGDRERARRSMEDLGAAMGEDANGASERILERMAESISDSAMAFVHAINARPLYTIREVLERKRVEPEAIVLIGGPAPQMARYLERALRLPCRVPPHYGVANALGAAVARVTTEVTLQADTERGSLAIPEADIFLEIGNQFTVDDAFNLAREVLEAQALQTGAGPGPPDVTVSERQVFNMIRGYYKTGQNIRISMSITPGLIRPWRRQHESPSCTP